MSLKHLLCFSARGCCFARTTAYKAAPELSHSVQCTEVNNHWFEVSHTLTCELQ